MTVVTSKADRSPPADPGSWLAEERGTTITDLLEELASHEPTATEQEQRAREAARKLGIEYTDQVAQARKDAWARIRAHQGAAARACQPFWTTRL
ncbi:hypothetical protein [Streptomyces sp. NPDC055056]